MTGPRWRAGDIDPGLFEMFSCTSGLVSHLRRAKLLMSAGGGWGEGGSWGRGGGGSWGRADAGPKGPGPWGGGSGPPWSGWLGWGGFPGPPGAARTTHQGKPR